MLRRKDCRLRWVRGWALERPRCEVPAGRLLGLGPGLRRERSQGRAPEAHGAIDLQGNVSLKR